MARRLASIPNLSRLETSVTVEIYDLLSTVDRSFLSKGELHDVYKKFLSVGLIELLIAQANINGYYRISGNTNYSLTPAGLDFIISQRNSPEINTYLADGLDWVFSSQETSPHHIQNSALFDDEWSPLTLDKSLPSYSNMIEASQNAFDAIEGNNGYSTSEPAERDAIVLAIRGGLEIVKSGSPSRLVVISNLIQPFQFISKKFAETAMGELAKLAVKAILIYFGWR